MTERSLLLVDGWVNLVLGLLLGLSAAEAMRGRR